MFKEEQPVFTNARPPRIKKAFSDHLNTLMLLVVGFLLVFIFMVALVRITVDAEIDWVEVGVQTVLTYVCTVSIHIILRSYARRKGRETEAWKTAHQRIETLGEQIVTDGYAPKTSEYCRAWEEYEVSELRRRCLADVGIPLEVFMAQYIILTKRELRKKYPELTKEQRKAIKQAKKIKRLHYDEAYLSSKRCVSAWRRAPSGGIKTKTIIRLQTAQTLVTSAIASVFTASIATEVIMNFTYATIVACLIKIATLVIFAAFGIIGGYRFAAVREVDEMKDRADEQARFLKWCGTEPNLTQKAEE